MKCPILIVTVFLEGQNSCKKTWVKWAKPVYEVIAVVRPRWTVPDVNCFVSQNIIKYFPYAIDNFQTPFFDLLSSFVADAEQRLVWLEVEMGSLSITLIFISLHYIFLCLIKTIRGFVYQSANLLKIVASFQTRQNL